MRHTLAWDVEDAPEKWKPEIQALLLMRTSGALAQVLGEFLSHQAMVTKGSVCLSRESSFRQDPCAGKRMKGGGGKDRVGSAGYVTWCGDRVLTFLRSSCSFWNDNFGITHKQSRSKHWDQGHGFRLQVSASQRSLTGPWPRFLHLCKRPASRASTPLTFPISWFHFPLLGSPSGRKKENLPYRQ